MRNNFIILFFATSVFLTGCSSMNSKFNCPMQGGVTCKSVGEVNRMVDNGQLGKASYEESSHHDNHNKNAFQNNNVLVADNNKESESQLPAIGHSSQAFDEPTRNQETIMRVWIAPYQDANDSYHQQSFVYAITQKGRWVARQKAEKIEDKTIMDESTTEEPSIEKIEKAKNVERSEEVKKTKRAINYRGIKHVRAFK